MNAPTISVPLSSLTGVIERITFHSEESGYTVARLNVGNIKQLITIVGSFANIQAGQTLQLQGQWREHPQYGSQFQVVRYKETKPATLAEPLYVEALAIADQVLGENHPLTETIQENYQQFQNKYSGS